MKIVLITTTFLVAVLATGVIGIGIDNNYNNNNSNIPNAFAQENAVSIVAGSSNPSAKEFYVPKEITVSPGTTVTWTNDDTTIHTVVEGGGPQSGGATPAFDSSIIAPGATWDNTFDTAGEFNYYCNLHPFMTGKVTVS